MEARQAGMAKLDGHNEEKIQRKIPMNTEYLFENDMPTLDEFVSKMVVDLMTTFVRLGAMIKTQISSRSLTSNLGNHNLPPTI